MLYADTSRGRPFAKDPAVIRFYDRYLMYYSIPPFNDGRLDDGWAIAIAISDDLTHWQRVGEILPEETYEHKGLCAPEAIVLDDHVHLFYQTYGNWREDAICHAVSQDGLTFTRNATNPVFAPHGSWTCGRAIDADVVVHEDQLLLYFATRDPSMTIQMLGVASAPRNSTFRRQDWIQRCNAPILSPVLTWEQQCIEAPAVLKRDNTFFMFYGGAYNNSPQQIGCATSSDGIHWTRLSNTPWLPNGEAGSWNACESGHPYVFADDNQRTYLFFQGNNDHGQSWHLSKLEILWQDHIPVPASHP